jgi:hypothetical protein
MVVWTKARIQGRSARAGLSVIFPIAVYIVEAIISPHAVGLAFANRLGYDELLIPLTGIFILITTPWIPTLFFGGAT